VVCIHTKKGRQQGSPGGTLPDNRNLYPTKAGPNYLWARNQITNEMSSTKQITPATIAMLNKSPKNPATAVSSYSELPARSIATAP
jgi:hypothetical protein